MKKLMYVLVISTVLIMVGAFNVRANSNYSGKAGAGSVSNSGYSNLSALFVGSVIRWDAISTSNMSFGMMTIFENQNSKKITWRSGQSSPYTVISEDNGGTIIHLTAAPKFDRDRCRYLKMKFNQDIVTVGFYTTKSELDQNRFFMEGSYEQVKSQTTQADGTTKRIKFAKGKHTATLSNSVIRGDEDTYLAGAKAKQKLTVKITSVEKNAAFFIEKPSGGYLENAGDGDDQTTWTGTLPDDGDYKITVAGTRGNATYKLSVTIK